MPKENSSRETKAANKDPFGQPLPMPRHGVLEREILESLNKIEHQAEILIAISHTQRKSGCHELAEAYRKQGMSSKAKAQSIRKLLAGKESVREEE